MKLKGGIVLPERRHREKDTEMSHVSIPKVYKAICGILKKNRLLIKSETISWYENKCILKINKKNKKITAIPSLERREMCSPSSWTFQRFRYTDT